MAELNTLASKKWAQNFGGVAPTLDISNTVHNGDIAIDTSTSPNKYWRCLDNALGSPIWINIISTSSKTIYVNGAVGATDYMNGSFEHPYKTVQAAINAASAGDVIVVAPGVYTEDLTFSTLVNIKSMYNSGYYTVTIVGKHTLNDGGGTLSLSGIHMYNTADSVFIFSGTVAQKLRAYSCKFESNSAGAHHALDVSNTHADSEIHFHNSLIQVMNSLGGAKCINTINTCQCKIGLIDTIVKVADDNDNIAVDLNGSITYWHTQCETHGTIQVADTVTCSCSFMSLFTTAQPCITTGSTNPTVLISVNISTGASPVVAGAGVFYYSMVSYSGAGMGFAATLNAGGGPDVGALLTESGKNTVFTSPNPPNWVPPLPTNIHDAISRIATQVAILLGVPIP